MCKISSCHSGVAESGYSLKMTSQQPLEISGTHSITSQNTHICRVILYKYLLRILSRVLRAYGVKKTLDAYIVWYTVCGVTVRIVGRFMWQKTPREKAVSYKIGHKISSDLCLKSNEFDIFLRSQMWTMHNILWDYFRISCRNICLFVTPQLIN